MENSTTTKELTETKPETAGAFSQGGVSIDPLAPKPRLSMEQRIWLEKARYNRMYLMEQKHKTA